MGAANLQAMSASLEMTTARLTLRPTEEEHAGALFPLMADPRLTRYLAWAPHKDLGETRTVLASLARAQSQDMGYHWTIFENGAARGIVSLIDVRRRHRLWTLNRAEIAYWVDVNQQGRGIATEATRAVVGAAFSGLELNRLIISHTSANPASGRIPVALGFRFIGTEHQFFLKDGVWHDMNHYELLAEEWRSRG